jgi:16S rRNA (adenine(1408)-N(1))-methyltransferase
VLAAAAAEPDRLVVGVDASAAAMAEASRRAARRRDRGGLPNAVFVVAAAEALPAGLDGLADRVSVHFPWGSLLRGLLTADPVILGGLARAMRPGAALTVLVSATDRDRGAGVGPLGEAGLAGLAAAYAANGLAVTGVRPATVADVAASRSSWGRRLGAGDRRPAWLLEASRAKASAPLGQAGQAGPGRLEPRGGRVEPLPGVGGGQAVADGAQGVAAGHERVQLGPVKRHRHRRPR